MIAHWLFLNFLFVSGNIPVHLFLNSCICVLQIHHIILNAEPILNLEVTPQVTFEHVIIE